MTAGSSIVPYYRQMSERVTVTVDGVYGKLNSDEQVPDDRPVGRVVITMPDYVADSLSHLIANAHEMVSRLCGVVLDVGSVDLDGPDLELSVALYEASRLHGHAYCRRPQLHEIAATARAADDLARQGPPGVDRSTDVRALNRNGRDLLR
jgi:hypothetical protein